MIKIAIAGPLAGLFVDIVFFLQICYIIGLMMRGRGF